MASPWQAAEPDPAQKRPTHLSAASIGTSASGIADSTITFGSVWTSESGEAIRMSQFPAPPTDIPGTPTTPRSPTHFADGHPPSPIDLTTPPRSPIGTPTTPTFIADSQGGLSPVHVGLHDYQSTRSGSSGGTHVQPVAPLVVRRLPRLPSGPAANLKKSTSFRPPPPAALKHATPPRSPISDRNPPKRPPSPETLAGASMIDWSDGASGISVNPSEERLLTTSFITSLLSQSPEPFPANLNKPPTAWGRSVRQVMKSPAPSLSSRDAASQVASSSRPYPTYESDTDTDSRMPLSPQSVPSSVAAFYPSDFQAPTPLKPMHPRLLTAVADRDDRSALTTESRRASAEYSDTLHSVDVPQVQSLVRSPSLTMSRAVGVVPAYRVSVGSGKQVLDGTGASLLASGSSIITTATTLLPNGPPVHRADASKGVGMGVYGVPQEDEEEFVKMGGQKFDADEAASPDSAALPSSAGMPDARFEEGTGAGQMYGVGGAGPSGYSLKRNQSRKSVVSSIVSRISNSSTGKRAKYFAWKMKRPLPPLPPLPRNPAPQHPRSAEIRKSEDAIPLPTLVKRAEALGDYLDVGQLPAGSIHSSEGYGEVLYYDGRPPYPFAPGDEAMRVSHYSRGFREKEGPASPKSRFPTFKFNLKKRSCRLRAIIVCVIVGVVLVVAISVGVTAGRKHSSQAPCPANFTGATCAIDATCVCTLNSSTTCKPLSSPISLLLDTVNTQFATNLTASEVADAIAAAQGQVVGSQCAKQAQLIDVAPNLNPLVAPNRTQWARAAIVWNLVLSQDINSATTMQKFVSKAPWSTLSTKDGPVEDAGPNFVLNVSGYTFDFAAQTVVPQSVTFQSDANPSAAQLSQLSSNAEKVLDNMYSNALASSTQRKKALTSYWTTVLQQQPQDLGTFTTTVTNSLFLLPFDATSSPGGQPLTSLMTNSTSAQFPPPLACFPDLRQDQQARIDMLEENVFGLPPASAQPKFDPSCFPDRPTYGVIDLLRLRLPFTDNRKGVALQASALSADATLRAVIYSGEALSALPGTTDVLPVISTDTRQYGTLDHLNHVLLNYLSSIANTTLAMTLIQHVLSSAVSPASNPALVGALSSLPVLEFAVFGNVTPQDITQSISSFSAPSGSLFFGSDAGQTFRTWALLNSSSTIAWAENATAPRIVREGASVNSQFESVWNPASQLVHAETTDAGDVAKVTNSLSSLGLFSPS